MNLDNRFDRSVFAWVQAHQQPLLAYAARDLTSLGGNICIVLSTVFTAALLSISGRLSEGAAFALSVVCVAVVIGVLKVGIGRPCPLQLDPYQHRMTRHIVNAVWVDSWHECNCNYGGFPVPHLPCMPSGHTTASTFLYGSLAALASACWPAYTEVWFWWGFGLPIAIGITRVYLSAHWASDVLAGFALGHGLLWLWRWAL